MSELYLKAPEVTLRNTRVHFIQPLKERIVGRSVTDYGWKERHRPPGKVKAIEELGLSDQNRWIEALPDGSLRLGALAGMSDVAANAEVRRQFPVVVESLQSCELNHRHAALRGARSAPSFDRRSRE